MPAYAIRCKFCREDAEVWRHSYSAVEKALLEWECPKCGCKGYEKVPARTNWTWGESMKEKQ